MLRVAALVVAASVTLLLENVADAAVWRVPLERHSRSSRNAVDDVHYHRFTDGNNKRASVWEPAFPQRGVPVATSEQSLRQDSVLVAKISMGTPPQSLSLALDVTLADSIVNNHKVGAHAFYDHSKSSTYQANGTQVRLYNLLDGFVSKDHVTLSGPDGRGHIEVRDQSLVELTGPDKYLKLLGADGYIGVGPGRGNATDAPSLVRSMIDQHLLDRPVVGLSFERDMHAMVGGVDPKYTDSDFHYFAQKSPSEMWTAPVSGIQVDGTRVVGDLGDALIIPIVGVCGPVDQVDALADAVGAENFALPCDGPGPDITFTLGDGFHVTLTKKDYARPVGQGWCEFMFGTSPFTQWVVGMPFLRHVYMELDFGASEGHERIGLARVKP